MFVSHDPLTHTFWMCLLLLETTSLFKLLTKNTDVLPSCRIFVKLKLQFQLLVEIGVLNKENCELHCVHL